MIIVGVVCLLLGWLLGIGVLWVLGIILVVLGAVLLALGEARTGGRRWY